MGLLLALENLIMWARMREAEAEESAKDHAAAIADDDPDRETLIMKIYHAVVHENDD